MNCHDPRVIHTIGHSTRPIETFRELLKAHRIELLLDVRRWPVYHILEDHCEEHRLTPFAHVSDTCLLYPAGSKM